ncbi:MULTISPECIES: periplasmic heavy metal sensor [unclassified Dinoroseobacter]|uniref:periplasmic heavy metal sensor n=1 Tax=unclassified Dinoroseobacter TaxID=2620028 RepID=UPI003C7D18D1
MTEAETQTKAPGRKQRWLLYGSLALNLLVVGLVLGAVLGGGPRGPGGKPLSIDSPFPLIRALDDTRRDVLKEALDQHRAETSQGPRSRGRHTRALLDSLRNAPFDPAEFEALLTTQAEAMSARNAVGRNALIGAIAQMSDAERVAYADRVEEVLRERANRPRRGDKPPKD